MRPISVPIKNCDASEGFVTIALTFSRGLEIVRLKIIITLSDKEGSTNTNYRKKNGTSQWSDVNVI